MVKISPSTTISKKDNPSSDYDFSILKGGNFLLCNTPCTSIFVSEEWNEEQRMMAEMVIDFCIREIQEPFFNEGRELEATRKEDLDRVVALMKSAGELGLCGLSIPETYGGMGLDFNTGVLFSEVIAAGFSFATTLGAQTSIGSLPIVFYGNEFQKSKYLPRIATGELIGAYALTEPTAGSDANAGKTRATLSADGKHFLINGQKIWITNGGIADIFIVFAKIEEDENLSAFIVEKAFGGITTGAEEKKMGIKGSSTVQLFFDNCQVPVENLLGKRGEGFKMALNILNTGRIKLGAGGLGGAKFSVTKAIKFALERHQFGQPIADFGAIKYKIGDITTKAYALDSAVYRTGYNIDLKTGEFQALGISEGEAKLRAVREFAVECAILKTKGSDLACYATDEVLQVHGGMGYAVETGLEMAYRDARITRIYEGTNEVNRMLSVAELTKRGLKTKEIDLLSAGKKIPAFLFRRLNPVKSNGAFQNEQRLVEGFKNSFLLISGSVGRKLGKKLVDEQEIVINLADILAEAYVAESVLLKTQKVKQLSLTTTDKQAIQHDMLQLSLYESRALVLKAATDAIASFASGMEKRILMKLLAWMLPVYDVNPKALRRKIANFVLDQKEYCF